MEKCKMKMADKTNFTLKMDHLETTSNFQELEDQLRQLKKRQAELPEGTELKVGIFTMEITHQS